MTQPAASLVGPSPPELPSRFSFGIVKQISELFIKEAISLSFYSFWVPPELLEIEYFCFKTFVILVWTKIFLVLVCKIYFQICVETCNLNFV